jgi:UTP--glucose-1-phosphate uridylyltransferase
MKAVIPAAGLGTRLLPTTKTVPKELLPYQGKPAIQWALEEAFCAGLREFVVVVSARKRALREYLTLLDPNDPLYGNPSVEVLERLLRAVAIEFVEQPAPLGLGDALLRCRGAIAGEPFALLLPDNVFPDGCGPLADLISVHRESRKSCLGLYRARGAALRDGALLVESAAEGLYAINRVFPKNTGGGESDLRPLGRSVLDANVLEHLARSLTSDAALDEAAGLDGLARDGALLGLLVRERFAHIGTEAPPEEWDSLRCTPES